MTNAELTRLALIVDRSGSMRAIESDMEGAIHTLLEEQYKVDGTLEVDIVIFDTEVETLFTKASVPDITGTRIIMPRGSTALNDAIGSTVSRLGTELEALPEEERPGKVILAIVTDGQENASLEYSKEQVKAILDTQRDSYQWEVMFFGAPNADAFASAADYGIGRGQTISYAASSAGTQNAMFAASSAMTRSRAGGSAAFTEDEQKAAEQA